MNDKVKGLVEWVAQKFYRQIRPIGDWSAEAEGTKAMWRIRAEQILSHPDLALIDRERELPKYDFTDTPTFFESGYNIAQQDIEQAGYLPTIPLAEALKEAANETTQ